MSPLYTLLVTLCISKAISTPVDTRANTTEEHRLPQIYSLSNYQLDLKVPPASFTNSSNEYNGTVTIQFSFTSTSDYIALHAFYDTIRVNSISFDGTAINQARYAINNVTNILRINLTASISGTSIHRLVIDFTGQLNTTHTSGFYKKSYVERNVTKYVAATQFEPTHARKAFPCFDEPSFKATFDVSITYPSTMNVFFNTPVVMISDNDTGIITSKFATTPKMSSYLLAFVISEFTCTSGDTVGTTATQVCSRNESSTSRKLAIDVGAKVLGTLNNFTNYNYSLSISKMDQVAIPDFGGAMENWGLVTYGETALLWDETESSNRYKQRVATVIAHEFAHQWFGDLVTCKWWSETFLNEGFASYFEYFTTHEVFPTWELDKQFVIEQVQAVFRSDAAENVQALQSDCSTPSEISNKFGSISYNKGASVLRMLAHFLGLDNFRTGLQKYLVDNNHGSAEPEDLWAALNTTIQAANISLPADIATVMDSWIKKSGFPLLTVKSNGNNVTVTQERFLLSGQDNTTQWYVPVSYTISRDSNKFQSTTPSAWLRPSAGSLTIDLPANSTWIILNNQETGYYRVNYDDSLWSSIGEALLKDNFDGITEINRAQIVDDLFNLARVGKIEYSSVFNLTSFLANDSSYYPWYSAFNGYDFLLGKVGQNSKLGQAISSSLLTPMKKLFDSVPFSKLDEDDQIYTHKQVLALTWACRVGNEDCVAETRNLYNTFKTTNIRPNKNLRTIVYCNALRYSNDTSDWRFLWHAYLNSTGIATEQVTILSALGCSRDVDLLREYLATIVTDSSDIRLQDATSAFSAVYDRNPEGLEVAYNFVTINYSTISARFGNVNTPGTFLKGIASQFTTQAEINKLKTYAAIATLPEELKTAANEAIETAESNLKWLAQFKGDLEGYYGVTDSTSRSSASVLITVLAIIMCNFVIN